MRLLAAVALAATVAGCATQPSTSSSPAPLAPVAIAGDPLCAIEPADQAWLEAAPAAWTLVEHATFRLAPAQTRASFIFFDALCTYRSPDGASWTGRLHGGSIDTPDGHRLPVQVTSFAAPQASGATFMVMALPSVWRHENVASDLGLANLMFGVFVHEMTHTRQFAVYGPRIDQLAKSGGFGDDLDDDVVQDRFKDEPEFKAAVQAETALLYSAATADRASARARARQALASIRARQTIWYVGTNQKYAELEDVFLTLEGMGNLAGYSWLVSPQGGKLDPGAALPAFRRGGRYWSQDEGLAIMLAVQRLVPDWPARAFGANPATALQLLARAVGD